MQRASLLLVGSIAVAHPQPAGGFPPYRSTDAETAEPFVLEARLGLLLLSRDSSVNSYTAPLLRVNYGLPARLELGLEAEFDASGGRLGDAAVGIKWVPWLARMSFGVEGLVLLPVTAAGGAGAEVQGLMTARVAPLLLHLNAGGSYDARPAEVRKGWRAGALAEAALTRWRPGVELFTRQFDGGKLEALAGRRSDHRARPGGPAAGAARGAHRGSA